MHMPVKKDGLDMFLREVLEKNPDFAGSVEEAANEIVPRNIMELRGASKKADPNELIEKRFLCRGGGALVVGPTGIGKSSFIMQCMISWSRGKACFGMKPVRALRILYIQAENDGADVGEQLDGVLEGMKLTEEEIENVPGVLDHYTEKSATGEALMRRLSAALAERQYDLLVIDPAFSYLGGDASKQGDVTKFLRNQLNPLLDQHGVACILIHHTNKPLRGKEKEGWKAGDYAYLGSGSAEWANWARAIIAIRSIGSDTVFELIAPKRGRRLGWTDSNGCATTARFIAHTEGYICWREATEDEIPREDGEKKPRKPPEQKAVDLWRDEGETITQETFFDRAKVSGAAKPTAYRWLKKAKEGKAIRELSTGHLRLTGKIKPDTSEEIYGVGEDPEKEFE